METLPTPSASEKPTRPLEALRNALKHPEGLRGLSARARSAALVLALWVMQAVPAHSQTIMNQETLPDEVVAGLMDEISFARQFMLGESAKEFLRNRGWNEEAIEQEIASRESKLDNTILQALDRYVYADSVMAEIERRQAAGIAVPSVELGRDDIANFTTGVALGPEQGFPGKIFTNTHLYDPASSQTRGSQAHEAGHIGADLTSLSNWFGSFLKTKYRAIESPDTYSEYLAQPDELWGHAIALSSKIYASGLNPAEVTTEQLKGLKKIYPDDPLLEEAKTIFKDGFEGLAQMIRELSGSQE